MKKKIKFRPFCIRISREYFNFQSHKLDYNNFLNENFPSWANEIVLKNKETPNGILFTLMFCGCTLKNNLHA